jgi:hypothetical protein
MIKIDASNFIPKRFGTYLLGIIPGFFFETTLAFGDPALSLQLINRVRLVYQFHGYALLTVFVVSCLIVGQTFYLFAWFFDWMVDLGYRGLRYFVFAWLPLALQGSRALARNAAEAKCPPLLAVRLSGH